MIEDPANFLASLRLTPWSQFEAGPMREVLTMPGVESAEILTEFRKSIPDFIRGREDLASARLRFFDAIRKYTGVFPECSGDGLDFDEAFNTAAHHYSASFSGRQDWLFVNRSPVLLDHWPAQEFYRAFRRMNPREWMKRWTDAAAQTDSKYVITKFDQHDFDAIALKNDPIWEAISRFRKPYPPFDFNSGMSVRDVTRTRAMELKLIDRDTEIAPRGDS